MRLRALCRTLNTNLAAHISGGCVVFTSKTASFDEPNLGCGRKEAIIFEYSEVDRLGEPNLSAGNVQLINNEYLEVFNRLNSVIDTGEIFDFLHGEDDGCEINIYSVFDGKLVVETTDKYENGSITSEGVLIKTSVRFESVHLAITAAIDNEMELSKQHQAIVDDSADLLKKAEDRHNENLDLLGRSHQKLSNYRCLIAHSVMLEK